MKTIVSLACTLAVLGATAAWAAGPGVTAVVRADQPGHTVPKTLYGIFFEDINYAADGGIYAELVANRGFDWPTPELEAWKKDFRGGGIARLSRHAGFPVHPNTAQYLRIEVLHPGRQAAGAGVSNNGFGGIALKQGATYDLAFYARPHRSYAGGLTIALESKSGVLLARFRLDPKDWKNQQPAAKDASPLDPDALANWVRYTAELVPSATVADARLVVLCDARGTVDLDLVSLFPRDTYAKRPNGLRADLVELLKEMKPGSMRFPGGCVVEGTDMANMYDWKRTVGPIERRPVNRNLWGYWQSGGLGFFEYFQLAEDIGASPLPILAAGMSCQFRNAEIPFHYSDGGSGLGAYGYFQIKSILKETAITLHLKIAEINGSPYVFSEVRVRGQHDAILFPFFGEIGTSEGKLTILHYIADFILSTTPDLSAL